MISTEPEMSIGGGLWFPGKPTYQLPAVTARGKEIAMRRDELIGLLRDAPECDFELSLTDLVEKKSSGREEDPSSVPVEEKAKKFVRRSPQPRRISGSTRSRSDNSGVLLNLNVFAPFSLRRCRTVSGSSVSDRTALDCSFNSERDREKGKTKGCWPAIWGRSAVKARTGRRERSV
ncbi:hypothetical protein H6P81_008216 [Aristolochia fimbriata]|uniref:Uncharacterized protein n=1 Tax=Aristolochia fimbriata TaxID=158543 RepID=A0AAV7F698_ARIFI|nr:hypothetical protein H6P81_008216 [Aristolochia fimbriata]